MSQPQQEQSKMWHMISIIIRLFRFIPKKLKIILWPNCKSLPLFNTVQETYFVREYHHEHKALVGSFLVKTFSFELLIRCYFIGEKTKWSLSNYSISHMRTNISTKFCLI